MLITLLFIELIGLGACRLKYGEDLQKLLDGGFHVPSGDAGWVKIDQFTIEISLKDILEFSELSIFSQDNYSNLADVAALLKTAKVHNAYGDYLYLWSALKYQGVAFGGALNYNARWSGEFKKLKLRCSDLTNHLVLSTSNTKLRTYYMTMLADGTEEDQDSTQENEYKFVDQAEGLL